MTDTEASPPSVPSNLFTPTHWSVVLEAREKSEEALAALCASYRTPLLSWLRIRGVAPHDAEDLVQGFFAHLLTRDFLENVSQSKGRFRAFLLVSLKNFLRDAHSKQSAAKRGSGQPIASLAETAEDGRLRHNPSAPGDSPDLEFDRAWANTILSNAFRQLENECAQSGHGALCAALEPVLFADETAFSYREIGGKLDLSEGAVKVAAHRLRVRLKNLIRTEVLQTVADEQTLDDELRYLITLFKR